MPSRFLLDVTIINRARYGDRLKNFDVRIGNDKDNYRNNPTCHDRVGQASDNEAVRVQCKPPLPGRYVRVQMFGKGILTMCEVLVYSRLGESCRNLIYYSNTIYLLMILYIPLSNETKEKSFLKYMYKIHLLLPGGYGDKCLLNNGGCDQICYNSCGRKVQCACGVGYKLAYDKTTCLGMKL